MFVETKKEGEAQIGIPSMEGLIAWLETKRPEAKYDYDNCAGRCLLGLYLNAIGLRWDKNGGPGSDVWHRGLWKGPFGNISAVLPHTFGAALERARRLKPRD